MFSKPIVSLRGLSGIALTLLFLAGYSCVGAGAQPKQVPTVIASFPSALNTSNAKWQTVSQTAVDAQGDWLVVDETNAALYEVPAGTTTAVTLVAAGGLSSGASGVYNPGIAIDPGNNLYLEGNSCILMFPYSGGTWPGLASLTSANPSPSACATAFYNFGAGYRTEGLAIGNTGSPNILVGAIQTSGGAASYSIVSIPVTGSWSAPVPGTPQIVISGLQAPAASLAEDASGNIYFVEDSGVSGALPGAYEIPAGTTGLTTDSALTRIDPTLPQSSQPSVNAVVADNGGDVYISEGAAGLYMLPAGFTSSASAAMVTNLSANGEVGVYGSSAKIFVPTGHPNGDAKLVGLNTAEFGTQKIGSTTNGTVTFSFNSALAPPSSGAYSIAILESETATPDFALASVSGNGSCQTELASGYQALSSCAVPVSFTPGPAGSVSAKLVFLDPKGNILASLNLHGTNQAGAAQFEAAPQFTIASGLKSPGQIATDAAGNLYVADAGLGAVEMFPAGATSSSAPTSIGSKLTAPTGVAVDGAGDVFIADSGSVYEVPEGSSGPNSAAQITLQTGLGADVQLAADGLGDLYVSDITNQKVYELENFSSGWDTGLAGPFSSQTVTLSGAAFSAPSAIAVDSNNNLYVVNGTHLYMVTPGGVQTSVLPGLNAVTGLTVDPSGSVYVASPSGTVRVPNESGTLNAADETAVGAGVTEPTSVVLDRFGNIYVADGTALDVNVTSASASVNFPTITVDPGSQPETVTLLNYGNDSLSLTGFVDTPDYSGTATTCTSVAVNATCTVTVTFSAGMGDGGTLTGDVLLQGNVGNTPVGINGTGIAPTLANTTTSMTVASNGTVEGVPVTVTVASSASGAPTPSGTVTLTITPGANVPPTSPAAPNPFTVTATLANGSVQFDPVGLTLGSYTYKASYNGDPAYTFEHSSTSSPVTTTTAVPVILTQPAASSVTEPTYQLPCTSGSGSGCTTSFNYGQPTGNPTGYLVLATETGSEQPYSGTSVAWDYTYPVTVASISGLPMVGDAVVSTNSQGQQTITRYNYGSINYEQPGGNSVCGNGHGSASVINVDDKGNGAFPTGCLTINTSNNTIPDIMTFYTVTPIYTGTDNLGNINPDYAPSTNGQPVNFWALRNPMVQISSSPAVVSIAQGSSVQTTLTLTSILGYGYAGRHDTLNNYGLPLDLQCDGLPAYATCSFTYPTPGASDPNAAGALCTGSTSTYCAINVGPNPGATGSYSNGSNPCGPADGCLGPGQVVVTITTNVPVGTTTSSLRTDKSSIAFAAMFGLGLLGLAFRRKAAKWGGMLMVACLLLCSAAVTGITACGTTNLSPASSSATPEGSYWVTITAKETGSILVPVQGGGNQTVYGNGNQMSLPYTVNVTITK